MRLFRTQKCSDSPRAEARLEPIFRYVDVRSLIENIQWYHEFRARNVHICLYSGTSTLEKDVLELLRVVR